VGYLIGQKHELFHHLVGLALDVFEELNGLTAIIQHEAELSPLQRQCTMVEAPFATQLSEAVHEQNAIDQVARSVRRGGLLMSRSLSKYGVAVVVVDFAFDDLCSKKAVQQNHRTVVNAIAKCKQTTPPKQTLC
jgi:hypothetical protein